jgi:MinD-like ATPase involved in chromosome partitioning or flagellar assembly
MVVVLIVAAGAAWESPVLEVLGRRSGVVVLKRCVDVDELLAASRAGQADAAVVALDAPGLDQAATDVLHRHQVRVVAVSGTGSPDAARARAARIGVDALAAADDLSEIADLVESGGETLPVVPDGTDDHVPTAVPGTGRIVAVWGPAGAPGRTTLATSAAAELARRGVPTTLVDADPYGGSVAQHLGVLDEVSGLLSAARLTADGELETRFASVPRALSGALAVVTGLPRSDRWVEVRSGVVEHLLEVAAMHGHVVVDTGFSLEDELVADLTSRPGRNQLTLGALDVADEVVVVGGADPVGLSRLARGLVELRERCAGTPVRVVVNRMRPSLGWSEREIVGMVEGFARLAGVHFLPDDPAAADRALLTGASVVDDRDSGLARGVSHVVDALVPSSVPTHRRQRRRGAVPRGLSRRRGGRSS